MGELHLQIYCERLKREFKIQADVGKPIVNYRESLIGNVPFNYLHRKQTGGAGQYAKMIGQMKPLYDLEDKDQDFFENHFKNEIVGTSISNEYITAIEK